MDKYDYICKKRNESMPSINVYKASAGSGKTFTLAVQYIRLLITINPQEYRHTLAVTFTNKATAEMKDRILEQLYGIGRGLKTSEGYLEALQKALQAEDIELSNEEIRKRCMEALRLILHDYSRFRIETIDSFFQSVLRNLAHELGLNARLQVDLNDKEILSQAVDNMVDGLGRSTNNDVLPWIDNYVKEQIQNADNWDVRRKIKGLARIIFKEEYMRRDDAFRQRINDEKAIQEYRSQLYAIRKKDQQSMQEISESLADSIIKYGREKITNDVSRGAWICEYADKMVDGKYEAASISDKRKDALQEGPSAIVKAADKNNMALLTALTPICQQLLLTEQAREKYIFRANTINLSLKNLNPLRLLNHIENEVTQITNDSNRFILAKTPILLSRLIEGSDAPFVFEKMGTLFHNVMIDEFQDTSKLQWENFKVLLLESQSSGGQDLLVGDVKQSIYRFRNGDWHILKGIEQELSQLQPKVHTLDYNYRSDVNIIRFNNAFFRIASQLLDPESEKGIIQEIFEDVSQKWPESKPQNGLVRVSLQTDKNEDWPDIMLADMCDQIEMLHKAGLPYNKMAVLVRYKKNVPHIIKFVTQRLPDVKMISDEGYYLSNSLAVQMLIAALRMLIFEQKDPVSERFLIKHYLVDVQKSQMDEQTILTQKAQDVLPDEFDAKNRRTLRQYPLNELCEAIYRIFQLDKIQGEDAYLLSFFDELASYLRNGTSDIHSFLEYWETEMYQKAIPACQIDGISILTIHKSKGLQYHTVFMPYCDDKMEEIRTDEILWCKAETEAFSSMGTLPIAGGKTMFKASEYQNDYEEEELQRRIDEMNALYVAFTRPEHNLYIWGSALGNVLTYSKMLQFAMENKMEEQLQKDINSQEQMLQTEADEFHQTWTLGSAVTPQSEAADKSKKKSDKAATENRLSPVYEDSGIHFTSHNRRLDFRQSNEATQYIRQQSDDIDEADNTTLSFIEQGKLLHEIFSHIASRDEVEEALADYVERGILTDEKQRQSIHNLITKSLENEQAEAWFDGHLQVINECEIVHLDEQGKPVTHRPDRVMISPDEVIVVDFKFGKSNPKYHDQVEGYKNLLAAMYPKHTVRGYLWYVYRNIIEEV